MPPPSGGQGDGGAIRPVSEPEWSPIGYSLTARPRQTEKEQPEETEEKERKL